MLHRHIGFWFAVLALGLLGGCAGSANPSASNNPNPPDADAASPVASGAPSADSSSFPAPPSGARFTLRAAVYTDPDHVVEATRIKEMLIQQTKSNEWYVVHRSEESDLYYGFYKTFEDRSQVAEYTRAQSDRTKVASLVDNDGNALFPYVLFVAIDVADPSANKEWDLANNPGYWTLQIAVYKGSPERKQDAVDAVKAARAQGIEAYYRHGPSTSEVYIGSWPKEAIEEQEASDAESDDPNQPLLVVPGALPNGVDPDKVYDESGRKMKVVMPKLVILDPSLKRTTEAYPYYSVNGEIIGHKEQAKDGTVQVVPWPTYLVQVPHDNQDQNQPDKTDLSNTPADQPNDSGSAVPAVPGLGGLR